MRLEKIAPSRVAVRRIKWEPIPYWCARCPRCHWRSMAFGSHAGAIWYADAHARRCE